MVSPTDIPEPLPDLTCTHCGASFERGYVTAAEDEDGYTVAESSAVCDTCGWSTVGATGCAPTLSDFEAGDLLVRVERDDGNLSPAAITDQ